MNIDPKMMENLGLKINKVMRKVRAKVMLGLVQFK
jgi:hypothetical protein